MGFLARRRARKFSEELKGIGEMSDDLVGLPLDDARGQELRVAVEKRLGGEWRMPPFWSQIGLDYTNAREDVEDSLAFTDALVFGYALREIEAQRPDARPVPPDIAVRLAEVPADARQQVAMQTAIDLAATRLPKILSLTGDAWDEFEYWACQFNVMRSRGRRRETYESAGVEMAPLPSLVDYRAGLAFGYALRCCEEVSEFRDEEAEPATVGPLTRSDSPAHVADARDETVENGGPTDTGFDPLEPPHESPTSAAEDLLVRTEVIFVEIRAPSRIGVAVNTVALRGVGVEEDHPRYGVAIGTTLFGYAARMATARSAPLPAQEPRQLEMSLRRTKDGGVDYERIADDDEALGHLLDYAGTLADDQMRVLRLLRIPVAVWTEFTALATEQLRRNLRRNGVKRRFLPSADDVESLMRLGCAIRVIDEVAGEDPFPASAL